MQWRVLQAAIRHEGHEKGGGFRTPIIGNMHDLHFCTLIQINPELDTYIHRDREGERDHTHSGRWGQIQWQLNRAEENRVIGVSGLCIFGGKLFEETAKNFGAEKGL